VVFAAEFRGTALNGLFCADVLRPLDLVPLTDFTYKHHPVENFFDAQFQLAAFRFSSAYHVHFIC